MNDLSEILQRIDAKLDVVAETQSRHGAVLEEHQRRSLANEKSVELLQSEIAPLKKHVTMWAGAGKALAVLGTVASIAGTLWKLLG